MLEVNYGAPRSVDVHGDGQPDTAPSTEKCVRHVHLHAPYLLYIPAFLFDLATANLEICRSLRLQSQKQQGNVISSPVLCGCPLVSFVLHSFNSRMSLRPVLRSTSTLFPRLTHGSARRTLITLKKDLVRSTTSPKETIFLLSFIDPFLRI